MQQFTEIGNADIAASVLGCAAKVPSFPSPPHAIVQPEGPDPSDFSCICPLNRHAPVRGRAEKRS